MSRRAAERLIESERVRVNGVIGRCAMRCSASDSVTIDDTPLKQERVKLYMLNKPPMYLVTHRKTDEKKTIFDLIDKQLGHLTFCGRLDYLSQGLLLLTNSPDLAHKFTTSDMKRVYKVKVDKIDPSLPFFCKNLILDGVRLKPIEFSNQDNELTLGLFEGKNREIRRIIKAFNMKVFSLKRTSYGPFNCNIPTGKIKEILNWETMV